LISIVLARIIRTKSLRAKFKIPEVVKPDKKNLPAGGGFMESIKKKGFLESFRES
jgi:hypothetical protein